MQRGLPFATSPHATKASTNFSKVLPLEVVLLNLETMNWLIKIEFRFPPNQTNRHRHDGRQDRPSRKLIKSTKVSFFGYEETPRIPLVELST